MIVNLLFTLILDSMLHCVRMRTLGRAGALFGSHLCTGEYNVKYC